MFSEINFRRVEYFARKHKGRNYSTPYRNFDILGGNNYGGESAFQPTVEKKQTQTTRPFGIRDKFGYLFGDFGNDFFFQLVMAFLMVFYTDIFHINAATVGVFL